MPTVGFEPMIPASARPQTYALVRVATSDYFPKHYLPTFCCNGEIVFSVRCEVIVSY
jgi:hypothetical protein